jgi:enoyl-CoA hydratase/carnithine racemase
LLNVGRFIRAIAEIEKPLIAAVQGRAVGVGTTMLLHCDYVVLAEDVRLSTPFASLGLVPEAASSMLLPARIGHLRAFAMLAIGEVVDARDAVTWGLANAVVPVGDLASAIEAVAARIASQPAGAVQATKRLMRDAAMVIARMDVEGEEFVRRLQSPEAKEAFAAFAQRRAPDFAQFA